MIIERKGARVISNPSVVILKRAAIAAAFVLMLLLGIGAWDYRRQHTVTEYDIPGKNSRFFYVAARTGWHPEMWTTEIHVKNNRGEIIEVVEVENSADIYEDLAEDAEQFHESGGLSEIADRRP